MSTNVFLSLKTSEWFQSQSQARKKFRLIVGDNYEINIMLITLLDKIL